MLYRHSGIHFFPLVTQCFLQDLTLSKWQNSQKAPRMVWKVSYRPDLEIPIFQWLEFNRMISFKCKGGWGMWEIWPSSEWKKRRWFWINTSIVSATRTQRSVSTLQWPKCQKPDVFCAKAFQCIIRMLFWVDNYYLCFSWGGCYDHIVGGRTALSFYR